MEGRVPNRRANAECVAHGAKHSEFRDAVDVHQVRRPGHAQRHGRQQALPARQDATVARRDIGQDGHRIGQTRWPVPFEGGCLQIRSLHCRADKIVDDSTTLIVRTLEGRSRTLVKSHKVAGYALGGC